MDFSKRIFLPFLIVFSFFTLLIFFLWGSIEKWGLQKNILILANVFFLILSLLVFFIQKKSLHAPNPHQFLRSTITGMMLKMFLTVAAILVYYFVTEKFSSLSVVAAMLMYLFLSFCRNKNLTEIEPQTQCLKKSIHFLRWHLTCPRAVLIW